MITASICVGLLVVSEILPLIQSVPNGMVHSVLVLMKSASDRITRHHPPTDVRYFLEDIEESESLMEQLPVSSLSFYDS